mmetsp:Transcript_6657/g.17131  ORF Transcript_6657/g.17131 Transcript_6657/m.17131 type:complete len:296 (+) Transcript_6657:685-1572(+)
MGPAGPASAPSHLGDGRRAPPRIWCCASDGSRTPAGCWAPCSTPATTGSHGGAISPARPPDGGAASCWANGPATRRSSGSHARAAATAPPATPASWGATERGWAPRSSWTLSGTTTVWGRYAPSARGCTSECPATGAPWSAIHGVNGPWWCLLDARTSRSNAFAARRPGSDAARTRPRRADGPPCRSPPAGSCSWSSRTATSSWPRIGDASASIRTCWRPHAKGTSKRAQPARAIREALTAPVHLRVPRRCVDLYRVHPLMTTRQPVLGLNHEECVEVFVDLPGDRRFCHCPGPR